MTAATSLIVAVLVVATSLFAAPTLAARENEIVTWSGNTTNGFEFMPPMFDPATGMCSVSKIKSYFVPVVVTVNGTHPMAFVLQGLFSGEWAIAAHVYFYENGLNKQEPCANISNQYLSAAERFEMLVVLKPGTHTIIVTSVAREKNVTAVHTGVFVARLIPTDSIAHAANASDWWHPPVFHHPVNCQQQEGTLRPFLHDSFTADHDGHVNLNVYTSGQPRRVNTTVWVFAGNFSIENNTVVNDCQAKFLTGTTNPDMTATVFVNVTKGAVYTVAVEFDHPDNKSFWGFTVEPSDIADSNRSQPIFAGVPTFGAKQDETFVCAPTGVMSKYGIHSFTAVNAMYAFDFKHSWANDTIISLYAGTQTVSTGCKNFIAAAKGTGHGPTRLSPLVLPISAGSNYTLIVSSANGSGGFYELLVLTGLAR